MVALINLFKKIFHTAHDKCNYIFTELKQLSDSIFCKRKIIVISEKGITSIPISSKLQSISAMVVLLVLLWISFSTGKYVTNGSVIAQKDREIWSTNATNEGLQYQMADLHNNLVDLNKYFENIRQLDQFSQKNIGKTKNNKQVAAAEDTTNINNKDIEFTNRKSTQNIENIQKILNDIRGKVLARISSLENIIQMTGLGVKKISENNQALRDAYNKTAHLHNDVITTSSAKTSNKNQGGPFYPAEDKKDVFNQEEFESEIAYLMQLETALNAIPLSTPLKQYVVSSTFGKRMDPIRSEAAVHTGIDLAGEYKSKVYSSAPGVVIFAEDSGAYGRLIQIDHGTGIETWYGHLDRILVREGEKVKRGQLIGLQGNTGRSTGTHLHYEVRLNNIPINPANFLEAGKYVF